MRVDDSGWPWGFRHKAAFVFGAHDQGRVPMLGHYAAHSQRVVPIEECPVHADRANHVAFALARHLIRAEVPAAGADLKGVLRHLIVRTTRTARETVAMLVVTRNDKTLRRPVRSFLDTEDAPDGFYLNVHDKPGPYMVGRQSIRLAGRSHVRETVGGVSFLLSPGTFFQTNVEAAEVLLGLVTAAVGQPPSRVLDLYAGSGLFAIPLAARGHHVTAVEENVRAIDDAGANVRLNRLVPTAIRLMAARVEDAVSQLRRTPADLVILDPPRAGCPAGVLRTVFGDMRPARAVYVSCHPEALAAELPSIVEQGYRIESLQPVDMFPHTSHIETVATLVRRPPRRGARPA